MERSPNFDANEDTVKSNNAPEHIFLKKASSSSADALECEPSKKRSTVLEGVDALTPNAASSIQLDVAIQAATSSEDEEKQNAHPSAKSSASFTLEDLIRPENAPNLNLLGKGDGPEALFCDDRFLGGCNDNVVSIHSSYSEENSTVDVPPFFVPISEKTDIEAHEKGITAMAINPKGSRLATGAYDAEVHLWDFNGMVANRTNFRAFTPLSGHAIRAISYSPTGSHFVCAVGDAIARIYDVDGNLVQETVKGDMYVRDLSNTKGHTHGITDCHWHPFEREKFLTSSMDATIRVFDINSKLYGIDQVLPHVLLLKALDRRNLNISRDCHVTCSSWAQQSANFVVGGCSDGSLQTWDLRKKYNKPTKILRNGHDSTVTALALFRDDVRFVSRSTDHTMKFWDARNFKMPIKVWDSLHNSLTGLCPCLSPDESMVATGTSSNGRSADLKVFNCTTFEEVISLKVHQTSKKDFEHREFGVVRILWPDSLNQLIVGTTEGVIQMYYDKKHSCKGALLFADRDFQKRKKTDENLVSLNIPIYTMESLPVGIKETREGGIRRVRLREKDKVLQSQQRVIAPVCMNRDQKDDHTISHGSLTSHIMGQINVSSTIHQDPVEALRSYANKTEAEPVFVTHAYKETQPNTILDLTPIVGDDEQLVTNINKCPRCGLKMCQCGFMKDESLNKRRKVES